MFNSIETSPLVSIGVPVFNGEKYLDECLESIYRQTYQNWECFIINNKSTDNSLNIANSFQNKDSRFRVITNPEFVDITSNFNNTIKPISSSSKYFKVVCADDWLFPACIEEMVAVMETYPSTGICSAYRIDNNEVRCQGLNIEEGPEFNGREVLKKQLLNIMDVTGSETTVMYRIETLKSMSDYPTIYKKNSFHSDTTLAYELLNISSLGFVFQILTYTRRHNETYTSKNVDKYRTRLNFMETEMFKYLGTFPELRKDYKRVRAKYGAYQFKLRLLNDKKSIELHNKHLDEERRFTFSECLLYVIQDVILKFSNKLKSAIK